MNIEQAKTIPISEFLDKLNIKPVKRSQHRATYLSPIRQENTASFSVSIGKNCWYDHGIGIGGDIVSLAQEILKSKGEDHTVSDALRFIENMAGYAPRIAPVVQVEEQKPEPTLSITSVTKIEHGALTKYLASRGISLKLAHRYLKELKIYNQNSGKHFKALGFKNDEGGYEARNAGYKGCIGRKDVTVIRGENEKRVAVHIFEGFMDFLTTLERRNVKRLQADAIILNSLSMLGEATPLIQKYTYRVVYSWMDNDDAGVSATSSLDAFIKTQENLRHKTMNHVYKEHKDVNSWHMAKLRL